MICTTVLKDVAVIGSWVKGTQDLYVLSYKFHVTLQLSKNKKLNLKKEGIR